MDSVKLLTIAEKQRLRDILAEEFDPLELLPPGFEIKPGAVFQMGSQVTTDEAGLKLIYKLAGIPSPT